MSASRSEAQLSEQPSPAAPPALPAELADWPACTLGQDQLGDLELLTSGAFAPLRGFMDAAEVAAVTEHGTLADGTPWPVPVVLDVPAGTVPADATRLVLQDPEGSPLAVLSITERAPISPGSGDSGLVRLAGPVTALREPEHGPFRQLRRRPAGRTGRAGRQAPGERARLRDPAAPEHAAHRPVAPLRGSAERPPAGAAPGLRAGRDRDPAGSTGPRDPGGQAASAVRHCGGPGAARAARRRADLDLRAQGIVAAAYGATHLLADSVRRDGGSAAGTRNGTLTLPGVPIPVVSAGEWAYDPRSEVWRPLALIEPGAEQDELTASELGALLDSGAEVPGWLAPPSVARSCAGPDRRGPNAVWRSSSPGCPGPASPPSPAGSPRR